MKRFSLEGYTTTDAVVTSVYDGDTFTAGFPLPQCPGGERYLWSCRLLGVDTPEIRDAAEPVRKHAVRARERVRELLIDKAPRLHLGKFEKYGRVLVSVELEDGRDLARLLIAEGLACQYDGKARPDWNARLAELATSPTL